MSDLSNIFNFTQEQSHIIQPDGSINFISVFGAIVTISVLLMFLWELHKEKTSVCEIPPKE